ncbi:hypothetical protein TBR22_A37440 [Luteitalea sp. TBR-22]|uniref:hypothetical protein n=1 Tax=Luteitalea sp. TBR-22 TaxID=2802971 RepID=UPI001AF4879C|nr:hypothetical protein [Luteitalea sp. TBR-22]BCS34516.1 hypothetical protein TBR22_A37440 [Luteitalea sp. TBR-22]
MAKLPAQSSAVRTPTAPERTSLGLTSRQAALLAYSAGWISGVLVLWLEARDRPSRWHAAQSVLGFGVLSLLGVATLGVAAVGLLSSLALFRVGVWATQFIVVVGFGFWAWSLARVALGGTPRWPLLGDRVDRLAEPH